MLVTINFVFFLRRLIFGGSVLYKKGFQQLQNIYYTKISLTHKLCTPLLSEYDSFYQSNRCGKRQILRILKKKRRGKMPATICFPDALDLKMN